MKKKYLQSFGERDHRPGGRQRSLASRLHDAVGDIFESAGMALLISSAFVAGIATVHVRSAAAASQSLGGINLTEVAPRIVTPNGDLRNDVVFFRFDDTLTGLPIENAIMDINGAKVAGLHMDSSETSLMWDGKDDAGRSLPAGIYIYSIKIGKNLVSGTIVLAR